MEPITISWSACSPLYMARTKDTSTHQDFLRVADPPRQILDIAVRLHHFGGEFNAEPV